MQRASRPVCTPICPMEQPDVQPDPEDDFQRALELHKQLNVKTRQRGSRNASSAQAFQPYGNGKAANDGGVKKRAGGGARGRAPRQHARARLPPRPHAPPRTPAPPACPPPWPTGTALRAAAAAASAATRRRAKSLAHSSGGRERGFGAAMQPPPCTPHPARGEVPATAPLEPCTRTCLCTVHAMSNTPPAAALQAASSASWLACAGELLWRPPPPPAAQTWQLPWTPP